MKKFLSLVLALVMTMSLVTISAGAKDFTDNSSITYNEAIDVMSAVKVIDGYPDGSFKPSTQLNRGQAAKILCNMLLGPTTASALSFGVRGGFAAARKKSADGGRRPSSPGIPGKTRICARRSR